MSHSALEVLTEWNWEPSVIMGIALLALVYLGAATRWRDRFEGSAPMSRGRIISFQLGLMVLLIALVSPLDAISDHYLFSVHMVQHLLMTLLAPALLLMGTPAWMVHPILKRATARTVLRTLTMPVVAFLLFNLDFALWHIPALYEATLENDLIHVVEHISFIGMGILNWWPILSPLPELRLAYPGQILYLFLDAVPSTVLGAILVFATDVLYPTYALAPRIFGTSATDDQILAGLIMAMPGGMAYLLALSIVFFIWMGRESPSESEGIAASSISHG